MAHGAPTYTTGSLGAAASAQAQLDAFLPILESAITGYLSSATQAWDIYDELDATLAARDRVYRSVGDRSLVSGAGDANLILRIGRPSTSALAFFAYQDWSTLSSTGSRQNFTAHNITLTAAALDYFIWVNEYEIYIIVNVSGSWRFFFFCSPVRTHIMSAHTGVAKATAAATAGTSVVVSLDRDISSSILVGSNVWIMNVTAAGDALEPDAIQIVEVEAVTATTITLTFDTNIPSGALIGADPSPVATFGGVNSLNVSGYSVQDSNGEYALNAKTVILRSQLQAFPEAEGDPQVGLDLYMGSPLILVESAAPLRFRGTSSFASFWPQGAQADPVTDTMRDVNTNVEHKYFSTLLNALSRGIAFVI